MALIKKMENIEFALKSVFQFVRNQENVVTPLTFSINPYIKSDAFTKLTEQISQSYDEAKKNYYSIIAHERFEDVLNGFNFTINACLNSNKSIDKINEILLETIGIIIKPEEFTFATTSSKEFIKSKIDTSTTKEIEKLFDSRIISLDYTQKNNSNYTQDKNSFVLACILLRYYSKKYYNPIEEVSNKYDELKNYFLGIGINLMTDPQFSHYNLLSIGKNFVLKEMEPLRIYDTQSNTTIFLNGVKPDSYRCILKHYKKCNFNLSFKPSSFFYLKGEWNKQLIQEELETGKYFDIKHLYSKSISKLYNHNYDTLWVNISNGEITFEEIISESKNFQNMKITQVVHSKYISNDGQIFIDHLDHEYIFYTLEEFELRKSDYLQKGSAKKRIKTFKIDNAKIPITDTDNLLYDIVYDNFENKSLIEEYFQNKNN